MSRTKLDIYDTRLHLVHNELKKVEIDDLTPGDVISITGQLVSSDNLIYLDSYRGKVLEYSTSPSILFKDMMSMVLYL